MAQISDRSPHQGCKQTEIKEAVSMSRDGFDNFNTPEVHMNTQWSWREDGGGMPCTMSHCSRHGTWLALGGMGSSWGSCNNEMNERTAPYNQRRVCLILSASVKIRELFLYMKYKWKFGPSYFKLLLWEHHLFKDRYVYKDRGGKNRMAVTYKQKNK